MGIPVPDNRVGDAIEQCHDGGSLNLPELQRFGYHLTHFSATPPYRTVSQDRDPKQTSTATKYASPALPACYRLHDQSLSAGPGLGIMRRREFITLLAGAVPTWPLAAGAQQGDRMRRIGVLMTTAANDPQSEVRNAAFLQGLKELGWSIGQNLHIDYRWTAGSSDDTRKQATELAALAPDVIFAGGSASVGPFAAGDP